MYLLELRKNGEVQIEDDGVYAVPEFRELLDNEKYGYNYFKAVVLYYDYRSPFRFQAKGDPRLRAVSKHVFQTDRPKFWKHNAVKKAVDAYMFLQKDPLREHLDSLRDQLKNYSDFLSIKPTNIDDITKSIKAQEAIKKLKESIRETEAEVADGIQSVEIKGRKIMSWLEEREYINRKQQQSIQEL